MATLEYELDGEHRVFELAHRCVCIGRDNGNDLQFAKDSELSRKHCSIVRQEGDYLLRDDSSVNGTFLNELPVEVAVPKQLNDGDEIRIGKTYLTFKK